MFPFYLNPTKKLVWSPELMLDWVSSFVTICYKSFFSPPITEPTITAENSLQMTLWLKNNIWPQTTVAQYMLETAIHRANWIRQDGAKTVENIVAEFPRLMDTPGMVSLHLQCLLCVALSKIHTFDFEPKPFFWGGGFLSLDRSGFCCDSAGVLWKNVREMDPRAGREDPANGQKGEDWGHSHKH